jgi:endoglucanase
MGLAGCRSSANVATPANPTPIASSSATALAVADTIAPAKLLQESWDAYRRRFIQEDGRVIDWEADGRSTSEGQAYAMLRSVLINDPKTFELTLSWAENNLKRKQAGQSLDQLWAWKWGKRGNQWAVLDKNFASDADVDAITALILAARRWQRPDYLNLARAKLKDLWANATIQVGQRRYLLPGPVAAFRQSTTAILNPSYLAPYAFRLFAQVDSTHDWVSLIESSYFVLTESTKLSPAGLPSDWIALDLQTEAFQPVTASKTLTSVYGFDAYRVWWRVALDVLWFDAQQGRSFLQNHLSTFQSLWRSQQMIPARLSLAGEAIAPYEAVSHYGLLYLAFRLVNPAIAEEIYQQKLMPQYSKGFWENESAYYTQNLVWFGLLPSQSVSSSLLQPTPSAP